MDVESNVVTRKEQIRQGLGERNLLTRNALPELKWTPPKSVRAIDKRTVVNHEEATKLLNAMREQVPSGSRLVAFFAVMYYAAARPAEAVNLRRGDVVLPALVENSETGEWEEPENGWGRAAAVGVGPGDRSPLE